MCHILFKKSSLKKDELIAADDKRVALEVAGAVAQLVVICGPRPLYGELDIALNRGSTIESS